MHIIFIAAPLELMIIGGAALGAYIIANPVKIIKMGMKLGMKAMTAKGPQKKRFFGADAINVSAFSSFQKRRSSGELKNISKSQRKV
jgi:chemotaxis protein MotA